MARKITRVYHRILVFLHLSPLSLAEKCRIGFGAAILFILLLAMSLPYIWMSQLTRQSALYAQRARSDMIQYKHFELDADKLTSLPRLDAAGVQMDPNEQLLSWRRLDTENIDNVTFEHSQQRRMFEDLRKHVRQDKIRIIEKDGKMYADYMRLFRAHDRCIECHNPQGIAKPFSAGQIVGVVAIRSSAGEIQKTVLLNRVWIGFGGLIALTGAIIAFYVITQKVILSPIRQLRAMVNNVAEGNLDTRSLIQTRDEYQDLSEAFNNMLDGLQQGQEKLRQANKQLDAKIAELSDRNVELFQANTVKSEFLANISHEFRTPLNAILGFAEIIREKPQMLEEEKVKRYAENIITGGKRLLNMVNDLLDLAKTEAGKMQMRIEEFGLSALCQSVFATFAVLTRDKKIKVRAIVDADIPQLCTDAGKVQQILYNFISNAVNFTPEGGRIEIKASMTDEKHVEISVVDTGCGIAEGDQEAIFEKFRQGDGSLTRKTSGTGLGLAICKELAGMLAGSIGLESEPGVGSRFYIVIPINLTAEQTAEEKGNNE